MASVAAANCSSAMAYVQSTSDNSNLLGKSKKVRVTRPGVRVIGSSKKVTGNKKILKEMMGRKFKYHAHFTSRATKDTE